MSTTPGGGAHMGRVLEYETRGFWLFQRCSAFVDLLILYCHANVRGGKILA